MKLNNKGFAISTIMYMILIMAIILITITLTLLSSRKLILDKTREEAKDNIYTEIICEPYDHSDEGYEATGNYKPGEEYICEVKPGVWYNFFVLNKVDNQVNFIMDSNINSSGEPIKEIDGKSIEDIYDVSSQEYLNALAEQGTVPWISIGDFNKLAGTNYSSDERVNITQKYGPVTSMNYLYNATKDWINIDNININYEDEGKNSNNYGKIETIENITTITSGSTQLVTGVDLPLITGTYENLKTRLPYYSEVKDNLNKSCWVDDSANYDESANCWLYTYLEAPPDFNAAAIRGYWTTSSNTSDVIEDGRGAMIVGFDYDTDRRNSIGGISYENYYGVRPIITVSIDNIKNN